MLQFNLNTLAAKQHVLYCLLDNLSGLADTKIVKIELTKLT